MTDSQIDPFAVLTSDMTPEEAMRALDKAFNEMPESERVGYVLALHNYIIMGISERLNHLEHVVAHLLYNESGPSKHSVPAQPVQQQAQENVPGDYM